MLALSSGLLHKSSCGTCACGKANGTTICPTLGNAYLLLLSLRRVNRKGVLSPAHNCRKTWESGICWGHVENFEERWKSKAIKALSPVLTSLHLVKSDVSWTWKNLGLREKSMNCLNIRDPWKIDMWQYTLNCFQKNDLCVAGTAVLFKSWVKKMQHILKSSGQIGFAPSTYEDVCFIVIPRIIIRISNSFGTAVLWNSS